MVPHDAHVTLYEKRCQELVLSFPRQLIHGMIAKISKREFIATRQNGGYGDGDWNLEDLKQECWASICYSARKFREECSPISRMQLMDYVREGQTPNEVAFRIYATNQMYFAIERWTQREFNRRLMCQLASVGDEYESILDLQEDKFAGIDPDVMERLRKMWVEAEADGLLAKVWPRDREVLYLRRVKLMKLEEIGEEVGISRERVRQIEERAVRQIQHVLDQRGDTSYSLDRYKASCKHKRVGRICKKRKAV